MHSGIGCWLDNEHINQVGKLFIDKKEAHTLLFEIKQGSQKFIDTFNQIAVPEKAIAYSPYGGMGINVKFIIAAIIDCSIRNLGLAMVHNRRGSGKCEMSPIDLNNEAKILHVARYYRLPLLLSIIYSESSILQRAFIFKDSIEDFTMYETTS